MVALTKIDLELHLAGLKFEQEQWLDLFGVILLDPAEGLNSIKTARQLAQATTNPLLEGSRCMAVGFAVGGRRRQYLLPDFLAEMEGKFKDRYKFDDWKTIFDQVFEASRDGTAVEVVRAAMTERGVLDRPSVQDLSVQSSSSANVSSTRPSGRASSSRSRKTSHTSAQDGDDDESEDESDRDSEMHRSPRVTEIAPSGRTTFNKRLERIFDHYNREGSAEGSNARVYRSPVRSAEVGMDVDVDPIESRVYMIELPTVRGAGLCLEHLRRRGMSCQTFQSVPRRIFVEARFPLEVQLGLPPSHADLVREIIRIPREQMRSVTEPCDIPARSWISVCMDDAVVIPPNTLQFSKERGYDVTIGDRPGVYVVSEEGPWHDVPIGFCVKVQDYSLRDVERHVGREVWIISGPSKGYRGTLRSLKHTAAVTESGVLLNGAPLDPARMAAFIELRRTSFVPTAPPRHITPPPPSPVADPSAEPGPSTSAYNPWVVHPGDVTPRRSNETEQQQVDYGCVPWLFDDNFCDYPKWHVCLRVGLAYNRGSLEKRVVRTTAPDRFSTVTRGCGLAPPGHVSVTVTSSTVSANIEHHFIPARDLTPAKPTSAGQSCLILRGKLAGQIHLVKKCQSKKAPKGVELEDGTKLPFEDVCQVIPVNQVI
ncbi:hypothetical protein EDD15DRAFT_2382444 [Pisolithus albus]|nr:hypothetical protein EDD15DRAFT_2382444 [Pisolithus albus]